MSRIGFFIALCIVLSGVFGDNPWLTLLMYVLLAMVVPAAAVQVSATLVKGETSFRQSLVFSLVVGALATGAAALSWWQFQDIPLAWGMLGAVALGLGLWIGSKILGAGIGPTLVSLVLALVVLAGVYWALEYFTAGLTVFIEAM